MKWSCAVGCNLGPPTLSPDGRIYVGSSSTGRLYAVDNKGSEKWAFPTGEFFSSAPAIGKNGRIYFGIADNYNEPREGIFYALDPNGNKKWSIKAGGKLGIHSSAAIGDHGTIYFGGRDGTFYAIESNCNGLANSPWPKFQGNNQNTGVGKYDATDIDNYSINRNNNISDEFNLLSNYPNPFNDRTNISFYLKNKTRVNLVVYNLKGQEVARLLDNTIKKSGRHSLNFNAANLSSGIYIYKLYTDLDIFSRKMLYLK